MTKSIEQEALVLANDRPAANSDDLHQWAIDAEDMIRRQRVHIIDLEYEAQNNARIIGASAEKELALRAQVQELQRRVAKLENELSKRTKGSADSLKPVAWMHEDTFYNMNNTTRSEKTRWIVYNLSEYHSTDGMIPLYAVPVVQEKM